MDSLRVVLLGCGVVGSQVARLLHENAADLEQRAGVKIELAGIAVHDLAAAPEFLDSDLFSTDAVALMQQVKPDIVVELIGGTYDTAMTKHIWESFVANAQIALHVRVLEGRNAHHVVEAQFKAVARALRDALALDPRVQGIPSTKGAL